MRGPPTIASPYTFSPSAFLSCPICPTNSKQTAHLPPHLINIMCRSMPVIEERCLALSFLRLELLPPDRSMLGHDASSAHNSPIASTGKPISMQNRRTTANPHRASGSRPSCETNARRNASMQTFIFHPGARRMGQKKGYRQKSEKQTSQSLPGKVQRSQAGQT